MKVGLNLLHVRPEIGGGWNYIANILRVLPLLEKPFRFIAYCTSTSAAIVPNDDRFEIRIVNLGGSSQIMRVAFEQAVLPFLAHKDGVDCVHWFANSCSIFGIKPSIVTIHDFKSIEKPTNDIALKSLYMRQAVRFSCRQANVIAPISEVSADTAQRLFNVQKDRIVVVPNPIQSTFRPIPYENLSEFRNRLKLPPQFWLYVAHPYPHKNHIRLFEAYKRLLESEGSAWPLILRGDGPKEKEELANIALNLGIADSLTWIPRLSTEDMAKLYSSATALVFPSLYEGCGIPVLEAMACGCPLIASNILTTREFAGEDVLMFDATDVSSIARVMHQFASDSSLRTASTIRGIQRAEQYYPKHCVTKLRLAYYMSVQKH